MVLYNVLLTTVSNEAFFFLFTNSDEVNFDLHLNLWKVKQ